MSTKVSAAFSTCWQPVCGLDYHDKGAVPDCGNATAEARNTGNGAGFSSEKLGQITAIAMPPAGKCRLPALAAVPALLFLCSGCASNEVADTEQMLVAAGFREVPADTPRRQQQLDTLPPHQLMSQHLKGSGPYSVGYVYADPDHCHCVFIGNAAAYQAYQKLAFEQKLANERVQAAEMEENAFDWPLWGPGFYGPGFYGP
jgi:hypothetical protein